jgi:hypothetical protein
MDYRDAVTSLHSGPVLEAKYNSETVASLTSTSALMEKAQMKTRRIANNENHGVLGMHGTSNITEARKEDNKSRTRDGDL